MKIWSFVQFPESWSMEVARMPANNLLKTYLNSPDCFENLSVSACEKIAFDQSHHTTCIY